MNATLKKGIFTTLWTLAVFLFSKVFFPYAAGIFFGIRIVAGYDDATTHRYARWVGAHADLFLFILPGILALLILLLCLRGRLPGTRAR